MQRCNIYLTGFSGTGKSHSGRLAATALKMRFADMDALIEERAGKPIPRIFAEDGEPQFRQLEGEALAELASQQSVVVSTGGGVPVRQANREVMARTGLVIRLKASPETIHQRIAQSERPRRRALRPLLGGDAPVERIRQLLAEREAAYSTADVTIDTEGREPSDVAADIVKSWNGFSAPRTASE